MRQATDQSRTATYLFVLLLAVYLLTASLRIDSWDGETMYRVTRSLVSGNGLAVPVTPNALEDGRTGYGQVGRNGLYYSKYGLGWSLAAVPFCALARAMAPGLPVVTPGFATRAAVLLLNPLLTAITAVLFFHLTSCFYEPRVAVTLSLIYGFCTIAWYYAKSGFSEPLVTALLLGAVNASERDRRWIVGIALGGMILTRQTALFMVAPILGAAFIPHLKRPRARPLGDLVALLVPVTLAQLAAMGYNLYRFGSPLDSGYGTATWNTPFLKGLYNQFLSPGKGLFVFMPVLLLGLAGWPAFVRKRRDWARLILLSTAVYIVPHVLYSNWTGGGGWGPRLLLPAVPLILLPAGAAISRWQDRPIGRVALVLITALSLFIQVLGISVNWARHLQRVHEMSSTQNEYFERMHYRWPDSPIPGQVRSLREVVGILGKPGGRKSLDTLISSAKGTALRDWQSATVARLSFNVPDFWFVYLWLLGLPVPWLSCAMLILLGSAGVAAFRLRQVLASKGRQPIDGREVVLF
jgi:hypothetical protein